MTIPKTITRLNSKLVDSPTEKDDIKVQLAFDAEVQAVLEIQDFTFVNEAIEILDQWNNEGRYFEGIPYSNFVQRGSEQITVFDGFLDPRTFVDYRPNEPRITAKPQKSESSENLTESLRGLTFATLEARGLVKKSDWQTVQYIVEKEFDFVEQALLGLSIYLLGKEIYEAAYRLADQIATIAGMTATSVTGGVGALVYAIAVALVEIAYIALMITALLDLIEQFNENLLPKERKTFGIKFITALNAIFKNEEYTFSSTITDLDWTYIPSKAEGREDKGIPQENDYGFTAEEFIDIVLDLFKAKLVVFDGVVHIENENSDFFVKNSTYVLPDVIDKPLRRNQNEAKKGVIIEFRNDPADSFTLSNYEGTAVTIITRPTNVLNQNNVILNGLETVKLPVALGNRKDSLSGLENAFKSFYEVADVLLSVFGKSNIAGTITERIGFMKTSNPYWTVPKVVKVNESGKLAKNHRQEVSALYLYENYINAISFVANNFKRQREIYLSVEVPFGWEDFQKVLNNSYFKDEEGRTGKFTNLEWTVDADVAVVDFWIEQVYNKALEEEILITT